MNVGGTAELESLQPQLRDDKNHGRVVVGGWMFTQLQRLIWVSYFQKGLATQAEQAWPSSQQVIRASQCKRQEGHRSPVRPACQNSQPELNPEETSAGQAVDTAPRQLSWTV